MNDGVPVGVETCGDKLVSGTLQWEDSHLDGDKMDVALDGSQHLEIAITKITQPPLGRNVLSKFARK